MKPTRVVNVRWDPFDVYIGRVMPTEERITGPTDGLFGNPYRRENFLVSGLTEHNFWVAYIDYLFDRLRRDAAFRKAVKGLKGKRLGCWCKSRVPLRPCHGDILAFVADNL